MRPAHSAIPITDADVIERVLLQVRRAVRLQGHLERNIPADLLLVEDGRRKVACLRDLDVLHVHQGVLRVRIGRADDLWDLVYVRRVVRRGHHERPNRESLPLLFCQVVRFRHLAVLYLAALDALQDIVLRVFEDVYDLILAYGPTADHLPVSVLAPISLAVLGRVEDACLRL